MSKGLVMICITVGSVIGAWIPALWHADAFSAWGVLGGLIGACGGAYAAYKINEYTD